MILLGLGIYGIGVMTGILYMCLMQIHREKKENDETTDNQQALVHHLRLDSDHKRRER